MAEIERLVPSSADRRVGRRLAAYAFALAVLLAACTGGSGSSSPSVSPSPSPSPTASAAPAPSATPSLSPSPSPTPSAAPTVGACTPALLVARITGWSGAAGHRIADVELTNTGPTCTLSALARPQLVEGHGAVIIDGTAPAVSALLTLGPGGLLKTLVQDGNYCGPAPAAPVTVAFVLNGGAGRVVALPVSVTDTEGVPPCNGAPGSAGDIEMHPWAP